MCRFEMQWVMLGWMTRRARGPAFSCERRLPWSLSAWSTLTSSSFCPCTRSTGHRTFSILLRLLNRSLTKQLINWPNLSRITSPTEQKAETSSSIKEVFAEAKGEGYDVKILKAIVKFRAKGIRGALKERDEAHDMLDTYLALIVVDLAIVLPYAVWTIKGFIDAIPLDRLRPYIARADIDTAISADVATQLRTLLGRTCNIDPGRVIVLGLGMNLAVLGPEGGE